MDSSVDISYVVIQQISCSQYRKMWFVLYQKAQSFTQSILKHYFITSYYKMKVYISYKEITHTCMREQLKSCNLTLPLSLSPRTKNVNKKWLSTHSRVWSPPPPALTLCGTNNIQSRRLGHGTSKKLVYMYSNTQNYKQYVYVHIPTTHFTHTTQYNTPIQRLSVLPATA